jgi:putative heme degradation protein
VSTNRLADRLGVRVMELELAAERAGDAWGRTEPDYAMLLAALDAVADVAKKAKLDADALLEDHAWLGLKGRAASAATGQSARSRAG